MESLFEQMSNISKAHGYDILAKQVGELKQVIRELTKEFDSHEIKFVDQNDAWRFQSIVSTAKILSL